MSLLFVPSGHVVFDHVAPVMIALVKIAPARLAPVKFAVVRLARFSAAPFRFAILRHHAKQAVAVHDPEPDG